MYGGIDTPGLREQLGIQPEVFTGSRARPNVLVIGPQGSGKSSFAAALAAAMGDGAVVAETSRVLMLRYAAWKHEEETACQIELIDWLSLMERKTPMARRVLVVFGDLLTAENPACLIAGAAEAGNIIVGARRKVEMEAWFKEHPKDAIVEISANTSDDAYELQGWHPAGWTPRRFLVATASAMRATAAEIARAL